MSIPLSDVREISLLAAPRLLAKLFPCGRYFMGEVFKADSPRAKKRGGGELTVTKNGAWKDSLCGMRGGDIVSLIAFTKGVQERQVMAELAATLDHADRFLGRPFHLSAAHNNEEDEALGGSDTVTGILSKRWISPQQRRVQLLQAGLNARYER